MEIVVRMNPHPGYEDEVSEDIINGLSEFTSKKIKVEFEDIGTNIENVSVVVFENEIYFEDKIKEVISKAAFISPDQISFYKYIH